jgi:hypothetical protein
MACVLFAALLLAGCAGTAVRNAELGDEVFLQPAADQGPDPFTDSTATGATATGRALPTGTKGTADAGAPSAGLAVAPLAAARTLSGETPGLYSGRAHVAGCDVELQITRLTADAARQEAFAGAAGVSRSALPGYLRGLTPVLLRADTRVTNHAYRNGQAAGYQAVLQAGTAVLVDDRGVPRVRCACGNPLQPPQEARGGVGSRGSAWSGYRPNQVIVVTPAPKAVSSIKLVDAGTNTWIERRIGTDVREDHVVPPPAQATAVPPSPSLTGRTPPAPADTGRPSAPESRPGGAAGETAGGARDAGSPAPDRTATGCASTAPPRPSGPADCTGPSAADHRTAPANGTTGSAGQSTPFPGTAHPPDTGPSPGSPDDIGLPGVAGPADPRGSDGLVPDDSPGSAGSTDTLLDGPAGVLDG